MNKSLSFNSVRVCVNEIKDTYTQEKVPTYLKRLWKLEQKISQNIDLNKTMDSSYKFHQFTGEAETVGTVVIFPYFFKRLTD